MGKIIWLASFPKSGNTWLRAFLHNLLRNPDEAYDINKLTEFTKGDAQMGWYNLVDKRPGSEISKEEIAALRPKIHRLMTQSRPDSVFIKTHNLLAEDRGTPMITMEHTAGAIYVIRNPLDVTISFAHHYGCSIDEAIKSMATPGLQTENSDSHCYEIYGSWSENVRSWTHSPHRGLYVVRYEDMLASPSKAFNNVLNFLGLKVAGRRLEKAVEQSSFRVLQEQEKRQSFKEKSIAAERFFREGTAGQWRKVLSQQQIEAVVAVHQEQMARYGYWPLPQ
ncbi:MAG TPA: sulfotransferase domain-containing protein [Verrucomicrobiae bacterium]|nr:sulfotransferase domain-containing protein [Verrucomicrobiae bacterium]